MMICGLDGILVLKCNEKGGVYVKCIERVGVASSAS